MHEIDNIAPAFEEYCDKLALALEYFTDETYTREELIQYSFEHSLAEIKIEQTSLTADDLHVIEELERLWQERKEGERNIRDEFYNHLLGDDDNG